MTPLNTLLVFLLVGFFISWCISSSRATYWRLRYHRLNNRFLAMRSIMATAETDEEEEEDEV